MMKAQETDTKESSQVLKVYRPPEVIVYGDAKEITLNVSGVGTSDANYEGRPCSSPGNCG